MIMIDHAIMMIMIMMNRSIEVHLIGPRVGRRLAVPLVPGMVTRGAPCHPAVRGVMRALFLKTAINWLLVACAIPRCHWCRGIAAWDRSLAL